VSESAGMKLQGEIHPESDPQVMYAEAPDTTYKAEMELFDRWQSFAAELLRLSLGGIVVFGFLYQHALATFEVSKHPTVKIGLITCLSQLSVTCFAISTVCALFYRYGCTEAMMHYLRGLRKPSTRITELQKRNSWLRICLTFKILSAVALGIGAITTAVAFGKLLSGIG
jgi:uncharacterized membrane protein